MTTKVKAKGSRKLPAKKSQRRGRTSTSKLSDKNQVTVPIDILREIGLEPGDPVSFEVKDGKILINQIDNDSHPFAELIAVAGSIYDNFDLKKERSRMWPE